MLISDQIAWTWVSIPIAFLFPFGGLTLSSGSSLDDTDRVPGEVFRLRNTWELEQDSENAGVFKGRADILVLGLSAAASAACWALSPAAFRASAALWASAAALWDLRAGFDELLASVTLAVGNMERFGLVPRVLLSISLAPTNNHEISSDVNHVIEIKKGRTRWNAISILLRVWHGDAIR